MSSDQLDALVAWIALHPVAAGVVVFGLAFCDALVLVGLLVPIAAIFFAVGALIGLGSLDPGYTIAAAATGAFCGDALSYSLGRRYGDGMKQLWPFSRYPQWIEGGERFLQRHGNKGIVIARYVGAVRPFVPAIVGMAKLPFARYAPASAFACITWAILFLAPGWLFGASVELLQAIGSRLLVVIVILAGSLLLMGWLVHTLYGLLAPRAEALAEGALRWSQRHRWLGRLTRPLVDPNVPESTSVAALALLLLLAASGFFWLLGAMTGGIAPLAFDLQFRQAMYGLRTPLADPLLAFFSTLGDWSVLAPAAFAALLWLLWRRRFAAAVHWTVAIAFGVLATRLIGRWFAMPPPQGVSAAGFSFPAEPVTVATIVFGFFAVLIARELPGRNRDWPYLLATLLVTVVVFARLYFGAHWLSDALGGVLFGVAWIALLGIAYRRHFTRSFWIRPIAAIFYLTFAGAALWQAQRASQQALEDFAVDPPRVVLTDSAWIEGGWSALARAREDFGTRRAWPMNVQYAGPLDLFVAQMQAAGWQRVDPQGWMGVLRGLDPSMDVESLPFLDAAHEGRREALIMVRPTDNADARLAIHLWPTSTELAGAVPVWTGNLGIMQLHTYAGYYRQWLHEGLPEPARRAASPWPDALTERVVQADADEPVWLLSVERD